MKAWKYLFVDTELVGSLDGEQARSLLLVSRASHELVEEETAGSEVVLLHSVNPVQRLDSAACATANMENGCTCTMLKTLNLMLAWVPYFLFGLSGDRAMLINVGKQWLCSAHSAGTTLCDWNTNRTSQWTVLQLTQWTVNTNSQDAGVGRAGSSLGRTRLLPRRLSLQPTPAIIQKHVLMLVESGVSVFW